MRKSSNTFILCILQCMKASLCVSELQKAADFFCTFFQVAVCVLTTNVKTPLLRWYCDIKIVPSSNWNRFLQLYHILYSMWIAQPMLSLGGWYSTAASFHLPARESQVNEPREWRWSEQWGKRRRKRTKIKDWGFRDSVFWFVWVWPINYSYCSTVVRQH